MGIVTVHVIDKDRKVTVYKTHVEPTETWSEALRDGLEKLNDVGAGRTRIKVEIEL